MIKSTQGYFYKLAWFLTPFALFIAVYAIMDPFHVIYKMDSESSDFHWNRDVLSSKLFIDNYEKYKYQSYIFGSSRSLAYSTMDWAPYIKDTNIFHFDASAESIFGVYTKIKYINNQGGLIKNALIVVDSSLFAQTKDWQTMLFCKYYKIAGTSPIEYQLVFFRSFCSNLFFVKYIDYCLFHVRRPYMKFVLPDKRKQYFFDPIHNNSPFPVVTDLHGMDSINFYNNKNNFPDRPTIPGTSASIIKKDCLDMLEKIKEIFNKDNTHYKIIISPLYDQRVFNKDDLAKLRNVFGSENVYDYSGKNNITENKINYYEISHYKPVVGRTILKEIYSNYSAFK